MEASELNFGAHRMLLCSSLEFSLHGILLPQCAVVATGAFPKCTYDGKGKIKVQTSMSSYFLRLKEN